MFLLVSNVKWLTNGKRKKKKRKKKNIIFFLRAEIVVRQLDLQLPMQSVPITTNVLCSNPAHSEVYLMQHYMIKFVSDFWQDRLFYPCTLVSSSNKNDRHDITETLLKVALNTITLTLPYVSLPICTFKSLYPEFVLFEQPTCIDRIIFNFYVRLLTDMQLFC